MRRIIIMKFHRMIIIMQNVHTDLRLELKYTRVKVTVMNAWPISKEERKQYV